VPTVDALLRASGLPLLEARALLAHVLGSTREMLVAHPERPVDGAAADRYAQWAARRRAGEPLAYLLGEREFYGRSFGVGPAVLVPRPETESLVQVAYELARKVAAPRLLDLGTGSGCIAITLALEVPRAEVVAAEISPPALEIARANATRLGARIDFVESAWYAAVRGRFDVIVANPPYVAEGDPHLGELRFEPAIALVATDDGLSCLRRIVEGAAPHLKRGGWLVVEHGSDQAARVRELFSTAGFEAVETRRDGAGIERITSGCLRSGPASEVSRETSR